MNLRARYRAVAARAPRTYWIVWWGTLVNRLGTFVVPMLTIYLTTKRGLSGEEAGGIVSMYGAGMIAASIVGGHLSDRVGRRFTMLFSLYAGAACMYLLGTAREIGTIALFTGLLAFTGEMYRPAVSAVVSDVVPEPDRRWAYGLLYWAVNIGFGLASAVGGVIATHDFRVLFLVDAITMAAYATLIAVAVPETKPVSTRAAGEVPSIAWWRDRVFVTFVALNFLMGLMPYQSGAALSLTMTAQGFTPAAYGFAMATNGVAIVLLQPWITKRIDRYDANRLLVGAALLYGIGLSMHGIGAVLALHVAAVLVWTSAEILESPTRSALVALMAPADARGRYQSAFVLTWGAGQLVGPRLGTLVIARLGPTALWLGCLGLGIFVAICLAATARARRARIDADLARVAVTASR